MATSALADVLMRHQVALQRLSAAEVRKVDKFIVQIGDELQRRLSGQDLTALGQSRLERALERLNGYLSDTLKQYRGEIMTDLRDVAEHEAQYTTKALNAQVPINVDVNFVSPTPLQIQTAALESPLLVKGTDGGKLLKGFLADWSTVEKTRISNAIRVGVATGQTNASIAQSIRGTAAMNYTDGILALTKSNADKIVHTAVQHVATSVRQAVFEANDDVVSGVQWLATLDSRTCIQCASLDLVEFPIDSGPRPPAHIFCLPGYALVSSRYRITGATKRRFDGKLVVIRTALGDELTCTLNHPVLTRRGWARAEDLEVGEDLFGDPTNIGPFANGNNQNVPSSIEEIAESFFRSQHVITRPMPISPEDFHGEVRQEGEVAIVGTYRGLPYTAYMFGQRILELGRMCAAALTSDCTLKSRGERLAFATQCFMSRMGQAFSLFRRCALHACALLSGTITQPNTMAAQQANHGRATHSDLLCNRCRAEPRFIKSDNFIDRQVVEADLIRQRNETDPVFGQTSINDISRDAQLARDLINGSFGPVEARRIISRETRDFSGHVYNLETEKGFYFAGGIITHNCRCATIPTFKGLLSKLKGGERPSVGDDGAESVSGKTNYFNWLKTQPASFQDFAIGPSRAALLRNGGLSASRFAQMNLDKRFTPLNLDEMKRIEPTAFEDAGVDA